MFGFFRRKPRTVQEALEELVLDAFSNLRRTPSGADPLMRRMHVASVFGSLIGVLRRSFPGTTIENDSPAVTILEFAADGQRWDEVEAELDHVEDQVRRCSRNRSHRLTVMYYFIAPKKVAHLMDQMSR